MIDTVPRPDAGLPEFLAARARHASDGQLASAALVGTAAAIAAAWWRGPLWPATMTIPVCIAAFGFWGILDREIGERPDASPALRVALRVVRLVCAIAGFAAGATVLMTILAVMLGRIIS